MKPLIRIPAQFLVLVLGLLVDSAAACPADSVQSGPVCMDKYEASVWNLAPVPGGKSKAKLVVSIQSGTVSLADLQSEAELRDFAARPGRVWVLAQRDDWAKLTSPPPLVEVARDADPREGYLLLAKPEMNGGSRP